MNNLDPLGLKPLRITDRPLIDRFLSSEETMLSAYAFVSHYIWSDLFHFHWGILDDYLCLFAQYNDYLYMPIPPIFAKNPCDRVNKLRLSTESNPPLDQIPPCPPFLKGGNSVSPFEKGGLRGILFKVFSLMQATNKNKTISRIENIDAAHTEAFISIGYDVTPGEGEYVYLREDLANLKGDSYKSKRALCNHFMKNYTYSYEPFQARFAEDCVQLYDLWQKRKKTKVHDSFSTALSEDASLAHKQAIRQYEALQLTGRVVQIHNRVEGYLFGFKRGGDTFCILLEITNPAIRGLAQFIFREFCREMGGYTYINALGDSGLENLRRVKRSYRPCNLVPSYIAYLP